MDAWCLPVISANRCRQPCKPNVSSSTPTGTLNLTHAYPIRKVAIAKTSKSLFQIRKVTLVNEMLQLDSVDASERNVDPTYNDQQSPQHINRHVTAAQDSFLMDEKTFIL